MKINRWRVHICDETGGIGPPIKIVVEQIIGESEDGTSGNRPFFVVVRGEGRVYIEIRAFFHVARLAMGTMGTLVTRHGILWLQLVQKMCACLPTEEDIWSRTNTEQS